MAVFLYVGWAVAQDDTALALTLFEAGKKLADEQNYAAACPKFLDSYKLAPKLGTLLNLADCYEKTGKTASAWARFSEAVTMAERASEPERAAFAKEHADALAGSLATLTITARKASPDLRVMRDGTPIDTAALGIASPVDPGAHAIEASAPKKLPWSMTVIVPKAGAQSVEVPELENAPEPPRPRPKPCEEGDASCGRAYRVKQSFVQLDLRAVFWLGGFLSKPPSALAGPGTRYPGASSRVGIGLEAGLPFVIGLQKFPVGVPGLYNSLVVEPLLGWYGGATLGFAPTTNQPKGSTDFFFRVGGLLAYQLVRMTAKSTFTDHQVGFGVLIGYRPSLEYALVQGYFRQEGLGFVHGPTVAAVIADYIPNAAHLTRTVIDVTFVNVPATGGYFLNIGGGAAFP
jgi:hypothetical protein